MQVLCLQEMIVHFLNKQNTGCVLRRISFRMVNSQAHTVTSFFFLMTQVSDLIIYQGFVA